jgi:hypothetical protein
VLRFGLMINVICSPTATNIRKEAQLEKYDAGLDVSLKETSVCTLDETGAVLRELKVPSHPEDLIPGLDDRDS